MHFFNNSVTLSQIAKSINLPQSYSQPRDIQAFHLEVGKIRSFKGLRG